MAYINVDIDPWEVLDELSDDEIIAELKDRGIFRLAGHNYVNELADAYQLGDIEKVYKLNKLLIEQETGRII